MHANQIAPIPGSEGYFATRGGKILSTRFGKVKALRPALDKKGYPCVALWKDKRQKTWKVHQLVLIAFSRPKIDGDVCMHLNGDRVDNRFVNLRWGTSEENSRQMVRDGNGPRPRFDGAAIRAANGTQASIAKRFGCSQSAVSLIRRGLRQ